MKEAPLPENEARRLELLRELAILDTEEELPFDDLTRIAATICNTPIALVSLVDRNRQWFKAHHGLEARQTGRSEAFCAHAILQDEVFQVPEAEADERFFDNPLVTGPPNVKFYAGAPLTLEQDVRVGTLCVLDNKPRELTEKQVEALEALGRQVTAQLELRLKIRELEALDRMKTEFVAMVSHELRTPLTSIYGALSLLESGALKDKPEKTAQLLLSALRNSDRLRAMVNDILDLTRLESGRIELSPVRQNLNETVAGALRGLDEYFRTCGVEVHFQPDPSLPELVYDEARIIQVIDNLLSNAAKFSEKGSEVRVLTGRVDGMARLEVIDRGRGIPEDSRHEVFSRFSSLSMRQHGKLPGTGLGLNIAKQLVELHGGTIDFASAPGEGTHFWFELPLSDAPATA